MALVFAPEVSGDGDNSIAFASGWWMVTGTVTLSGSYATGGEVLNLLKYLVTGGVIRRVVPWGTLRGMGMEYDKTNSKLKFFEVDVASNAVAEHSAAAYDADLTATAIDVAFLVKIG
jgi:hypothetical protein